MKRSFSFCMALLLMQLLLHGATAYGPGAGLSITGNYDGPSSNNGNFPTCGVATQISEDGAHLYTAGIADHIYKNSVTSKALVHTTQTYRNDPSNTQTNIGSVRCMTPVVHGVFFFTVATEVVAYPTATDIAYRVTNPAQTSPVIGHVDIRGIAYSTDLSGMYYVDAGVHNVFRLQANHLTPINSGVTSFVFPDGDGANVKDKDGNSLPAFQKPTSIAVITTAGVEYLYIGSDADMGVRRVVAATGVVYDIIAHGTSTMLGQSPSGFGPSNDAVISRVHVMAPRDANSFWFIEEDSRILGVISVNSDATQVQIDQAQGAYSLARGGPQWVNGMGTRYVDGVSGVYFMDETTVYGVQFPAPPTTLALPTTTLPPTTTTTLPPTTTTTLPPTTTTTLPPTTTTLPPTTTTTLPPTTTTTLPPTTTTMPPTTTTTLPPTTTTEAPCGCAGKKLSVDYATSSIPNAAADAVSSIRLNTTTWEVEFDVTGVLMIDKGHVIAAAVNPVEDASVAFPSLVSGFDAQELWTPPQCGLAPMDVPASSLGVAVAYDADACSRSYHVVFSLVNTTDRTTHCTLSTTGTEVVVDCEMVLTSVRAFDLSKQDRFLAKDAVFRGSITVPRELPNSVSAPLYTALAKCSIFTFPNYFISCQVPGLWNFSSFSVEQNPAWVDGTSCAQTNTSDTTFVECDMLPVSLSYTEVSATLVATVQSDEDAEMRFFINETLTHAENSTSVGSIASFVKSIGTKDDKSFYGDDDLLTLEIEVENTDRFDITQLDLFNSAVPPQSYPIETTPEFAASVTKNATFFIVAFYPARKTDDSTFYEHGPHGVNITFLFNAASRRQEDGAVGVVTYTGIGLRAPRQEAGAAASANNSPPTATSAMSTSAIAIIAAVAFVAVLATTVAVVVILRNRRGPSKSEDGSKTTSSAASSAEEEFSDIAARPPATEAAGCETKDAPAPAAVVVVPEDADALPIDLDTVCITDEAEPRPEEV